MSKPITIASAQISTPTITVRQVMVDGKSMTQKTFRQIQAESIIDTSEYIIKGIPWGWVDYFWTDNKDKKEEGVKHILWQKGNELRRCFINGHYSDVYGWRLKLDDDSWKILSLTFDDKDFSEKTMLIKASINSSLHSYDSIVKLLNKHGSGVPVLPVYKIDNVQGIIEPLIEGYNSTQSVKYKPGDKFGAFSRFKHDGQWGTIKEHFFRILRETTDYSVYVDSTREMILKQLKYAYLIYTNNHLAPLNTLIDQLHESVTQLFI